MGKTGKGCLKVLVWMALILSLLILIIGILAVNEEKQEKVEIETVERNTDEKSDAFAFFFFGSVAIACIIILVSIKKSAASDSQNIESLKKLAGEETNQLKKRILNDHIGFLIQKDIERRIKPMVAKYERLVAKDASQEKLQKLQQYGEELNGAQEEVQNLRYDIMKELSDNEKEKYVAFCETYKSLKESKRIWVFKSSIKTPFFPKYGAYEELAIPCEVPKMPLYYGKTLYFYPRFVIVEERKSFCVYPISEVNLTQKAVSCSETGIAPSDAVRIGTTYRYVNVNGEPDRRYKTNPSISVLQYGELDFKPFDVTIIVSNNSAAEKFSEAFQLLQETSMKQQKINNSSRRVSRTLYNNYNSIVNQIIEMADWMKNNADFRTVLKKQNIKLSYNNKTSTKTNDLINVLIEIDFLRSYLKLGKYLDFDESECFGLFMLFAALNNRVTIDYGRIDEYRDKFSDSISDIYSQLANAIEQNVIPDSGFIISQLLGEIDKEKQHNYLTFLHQFAIAVANIDNEISEEEQEGIEYISDKLNETNAFDNELNTKSDRPKNSVTSKQTSEELQKLIGLQSVKKEVETLSNFVKIQQSRAEKGLKATSVSYHCVFTGNPGTGKTTVARIVANIYKELGVLKKGHLVETDRSGLVAEYVGQTAVKTNKVIDRALDGVLFIDEAYSLVSGGQNDFGIEAISTLLKRMEDDRDRLVVILAGYSNEMQTFINANPGLQSRFNRYIEFPDYSADELVQIFEFNLTKNEYTITDDAKAALTAYLNKVVATKDERFGNARFVRNLFEKTIERQANRLAQEKQLTAEMLTTIELGDSAV